jgi:hypothetical protein
LDAIERRQTTIGTGAAYTCRSPAPLPAMTSQGSARIRSTRLDSVRFRVGDEEIAVAFDVALELAARAERALDADARAAAERIRGAGASWPIALSPEQLAALARVIDAWERDAETLRRLRERM